MSSLQAVKIEGGVIPPSLFFQLQNGSLGTPESRSPSSYHLTGGEKVRDAANRSWNYLGPKFAAWVKAQEADSQGFESTIAKTTRDLWVTQLLQELGFGRIQGSQGIHVEESVYPVSHVWQHVPIHVVGPGVDLDKRHVGVTGAEKAPQAMVQELLNRSDDYLWAIVTNGKKLRLLRDSTALAGSSFIEFDLYAIFAGELFAEFSLLWQLVHVSRFEERPTSDGTLTVSESWLEKWRIAAIDDGSRALRTLSSQVEKAIESLGRGFIEHRDNVALRDMLHSGALSASDYNRHLLRLIYRFLFLFVAEDRDALLLPSASSQARSRYETFYSTKRLRTIARKRAGSGAYDDLWHAQALVLKHLGGEGIPALGLDAIGGLFDADPQSGDPLLDCKLANQALLSAIRSLAWIQGEGNRTVAVDYKNLGAEELGSVYEALLELVPTVDVAGHNFTLDHVSGNDRKTSGSYYTPSSLVEALLDSTLDPVLDQAVKGKAPEEAERALLDLKVVDPACGSGHFLVAAARRIASRIASLRSGEDEPTPAAVRHALRDVVGSCIYGVDLNPLAAELAKVSLWLEAMEPGKALGFLDARIRVGNSLIGTTPTLIRNGLPDEAFAALEGDDKKAAAAAKKRNTSERAKYGGEQGILGFDFGESAIEDALAQARADFLKQGDDARSVRELGSRFRAYEQSADYRNPKLVADAWCAAFMWHHQAVDTSGMKAELDSTGLSAVSVLLPLTTATIREFEANPASSGLALTRAEVERLSAEFRFFHWHIEFPEVFFRGDESGEQGWSGGFDCVLGNPPWERVKLQEQEFFASRAPEIAGAANKAARTKLIKALETSKEVGAQALFADYKAAARSAEGVSKYLRSSGVYPLAGRGDVNTYQVFTELSRNVTRACGAAGIIVPTGIATDDTTKFFFKDLVETSTLAVLFDFENAKPVFEGVHRSFKFCILGMTGRARRVAQAEFAFFLHDPQQIDGAKFTMTPEEIKLLNPNTGTVPIFRTRRDAEITLDIYRRVPVLINENDPINGNPWGVSFMRMFDMSNDSHLFHTREQLESDGWALNGNVFEKTISGTQTRMLPLYQGRFVHHFNHRAGTESSTDIDEFSPDSLVIPKYWVDEASIDVKIAGSPNPNAEWYFAFRNIARSTDIRSFIGSVVPKGAVGNSAPILLSTTPESTLRLGITLSSMCADYVVRQKLGSTTMNFFIVAQVPIPTAEIAAQAKIGDLEWLMKTAIELIYVANDMREFASSLGDYGEPFLWDLERRTVLRCELEATMFHLYGVKREDLEYIMETFPIVKKNDMEAYGEYRTKNMILDIYDRMQEAIDSGTTYTSVLNPPPGQGPRHPAPVVEEAR